MVSKAAMHPHYVLALSLLLPFGPASPSPASQAGKSKEKAYFAWKLGPEDFAWFGLDRKENGRLRVKNSRITGRFPRRAGTKGVFGWEVTGEPGYFQTGVLGLVPFSVGTSFRGLDQVKVGVKRARFVFGDLINYGLVELRGKWKTTSVEGGKATQEGSFKFYQPERPVRLGRIVFPKKRGRRSLLGFRLNVTRVFDYRKGVIEKIQAVLEGSFSGGGRGWRGPERPYKLEDSYTLKKVFPYRYKGFEKDVVAAIDGGVREIRSDMRRRGRFHGVRAGNKRDYEPGYVALALLTLVKAEVDHKDPLVQKCVEYLRRNPVLNTYSLGLSLMAFEAYYAPLGERDDLISGRISKPYLRHVPSPDLAIMKRWTKRLESYVDPRVDKAYIARWRYVGERSYDNSNTQYAVLGLHSATLCGIKVPPNFFRGAAAHFIKDQEKSGPLWAMPAIIHYVDLERMKKGGKNYGMRSTAKIQARGFPYLGKRGVAGSMTTAGLATLTIARSDAHGGIRGTRGMQAALNMAYTWLYMHFTVRENPGRGMTWHYYYLYGLERAMELAAIARLGPRDWYWEGAIHLLCDRFRRRGGWEGLTDTCFAVLFLKKAQLPVITGRPVKRPSRKR